MVSILLKNKTRDKTSKDIQDKESFYLCEKLNTLSPFFISPLTSGKPTKRGLGPTALLVARGPQT